ncbi:MAG: U32 family peptidase C-terminal domain-containing protein [Spirochaetales bacterium]|nr:U32 family peptidase C-terminal domain-containing protein [Spirochaetales bacterium]
MELLSPAGNLEKLHYAYLYGADAAYIGIRNFSLRAKSDNFHDSEYEDIGKIKGDRKLYAALNIYFRNNDLDLLRQNIEYLSMYPFDAFIVSDLGCIRPLRQHFPDIPLHLSTQANCLNYEAASMYRDLGFTRIIAGREASLKDLALIKEKLPDLEIEAFVHGAMCLAYSGRCFLSAYMADRSANSGDCAHSCRWKYRLLEEEERPGEYFPVIEGDGFTSVLSSRDMCLIDHLGKFKDAGIDSIKIEGRMKSIYYTAVVTRAYRMAIDRLDDIQIEDYEKYIDEIYKVSHREFSTGFYFDDNDIQIPTMKSYLRQYTFLGSVGKKVDTHTWEISVKNQIRSGTEIEYIGPSLLYLPDKSFRLLDENRQYTAKTDHGKTSFIESDKALEEGWIIRRKI